MSVAVRAKLNRVNGTNDLAGQKRNRDQPLSSLYVRYSSHARRYNMKIVALQFGVRGIELLVGSD